MAQTALIYQKKKKENPKHRASLCRIAKSHIYVLDIKSLQNRYYVRRLLWNDKDELNLPLAASRFVIRGSSFGHRFSLIPAEGKIQLLETSHLVTTMFEQHIKAHLSNIKSFSILFHKGGSSYLMVSLLNPLPLCGRYAICSEQCNIVEEVHWRSTLGLVCEGA